MLKPVTEDKYAFVELCKLYLGYTHIPGNPSGFNPSPGDEVVCLDMCLSFPQELIDVYLAASGQGRGQHRSLRHLAHGVVNLFYDRPGSILDEKSDMAAPRTYRRITEFIRDWKKQFKP
jgi:hypothetical protein